MRHGACVDPPAGVSAFVLFMDHLTPAVVLAGLAGLAIVVRRHWRFGGALLLVFLGSLLSKVLMFLDPANPDDHGYFLAAMAMLCLGASVSVGGVFALAASRLRARPLRVALVGALTALVVALPAFQVAQHRSESDLSEFRGPYAALEATLEAVPPRALVMPYYYAFQFTLWYGQLVEERRPDVAVIHQTFLGHIDEGRPYLRWVREALPQWRRLADAYEREGAFPRAYVTKLSPFVPIYIEPFTDLVVAPEDLDSVGILARVRSRDLRRSPPETRRASRRRYWDAFDARVGGELRQHRHTRAFLLWYTYLEAALHLRRADAGSLGEAVTRGLELSPGSGRFERLGAWAGVVEASQRRVQTFADAAFATLPEGGRLRGALSRPSAWLRWLYAELADRSLQRRLATTDVPTLLRHP